MKKLISLKSFMLLLLMMVSMGAWADETTHAAKSYNNKVTTDTQNVKWDVQTTGNSATFGASNEFTATIGEESSSPKRGTSVAKAESTITHTSQSSFNNLTKVVVYASANGATTGSVSVKVGETTMTAPSDVKLSSGDKNKAFEFTSSTPLNGVIEVSLPYTNTKSVWFGGVIVTTSSGSTNPVTEKYSYTLETVGQGTVVFKDGSNNIIGPNQKVDKDTKLTPTFTPADGYEYSNWEYYTSAGAWAKVNGTTFTITKDVKFRVTFTETQQGGEDGDDEEGDNLTVTYNFNDKNAYPEGFPTSKPQASNAASSGLFTIDGNSLYIQASSGEYFYVINNGNDASRGLFYGKSAAKNGVPTDDTAYLGFPAIPGKKLVKVVVTTTSTVGGSIKMNIYDESWKTYSTELSTTTSKKIEFTFDLAETEANTEYRLASGSSGKNLQLDNIVLTYEEVDAPTPAAKTIDFVAAGTDGYYATFSNDKAVTIPNMIEIGEEYAQFTVYSVFAVGDMIELQDLSSAMLFDDTWYLSENEGYLIKAESTSGEYAFTGEKAISVEYTELDYNMNSPVADNFLRPSSEAMSADNNNYKLAYKSGTNQDPTTLGFYWGKDNGAGFEVRENSAYLALPKTIKAKGFSFVDLEATSIKNVNTTTAGSNVMYNLAGQRVASKNFKGIVIVNGKKMLNK